MFDGVHMRSMYAPYFCISSSIGRSIFGILGQGACNRGLHNPIPLYLFHNVAIEEIKFLVTAARERLADLEVIYARECNLIAVTQSKLFNLLKFP